MTIEVISTQKFTEERAIKIAKEAHISQKPDRNGRPHVEHSLNVMKQLRGNDARITGVLHDVAEDTHVTLKQLEEMGCPLTAIEALRLITHAEGFGKTENEYMDEIQEIINSGNQIAIDTKWADLVDNSSLSRNLLPKKEDLQRLEKYKRSMNELRPYASDYLKVKST